MDSKILIWVFINCIFIADKQNFTVIVISCVKVHLDNLLNILLTF